ncbi:MAG TPA: GNAT family N-acetyltransferase [Candidatus Lokiarchaeia archaeon]|nr:GNAT family N-acetyltransferase [Candidatus Lokiarchaeia archaeon]
MRDQDLILETSEVRLRKVRTSDAPALFEMLLDPEVTRFIGIETPESVEEPRHYIENLLKRWKRGESRAFSLCHLEGKKRETVTGVISLEEINYRDLKAELGIWLGKQFWGTGIARTGITLVLQVAFLTLALRRVYARVAVENERMQRRFESIGFEQEGLLHQDVEIHNVPTDMILYAILREKHLNLKN